MPRKKAVKKTAEKKVVEVPEVEINITENAYGETYIEPVIKKVERPIEPKTEFSVYTAQGDFVRTYSVEIHGEEAGELAEMFAGKIGGIIK